MSGIAIQVILRSTWPLLAPPLKLPACPAIRRRQAAKLNLGFDCHLPSDHIGYRECFAADAGFNPLPGEGHGDGKSLPGAGRPGADGGLAAAVAQIIEEEMARAFRER